MKLIELKITFVSCKLQISCAPFLRRSADSWQDDSRPTGSRAWSTSSLRQIRQARNCSGAIVQLSRTSHPTHTTLADDRACTAVTLQFNSVKNWMVQRCAPWCSNQQHPEASTCAELCRSNRSSGDKAIKHQVTTPPAALAAGPTTDHIQVGCFDLQSPQHFDANVLYLSHHIITRDSAHWFYARQRVHSCLSRSSVRTEARPGMLSLFGSTHLEQLAKTVRDSDSLGTFKSRLKTFLFCRV